MTKVHYAIGDVHGEAGLLQNLHTKILDDFRARKAVSDVSGYMIHLGDYVDRGPDSKSVIDTVIRIQKDRPYGIEVLALKGNHEDMFLHALQGGIDDLMTFRRNGGVNTMKSYGAELGQMNHTIVPKEHKEWMKALPYYFINDELKVLFVHAGIEPSMFPDIDEDTALWTRSARFFKSKDWNNPELDGWLVVHGHTPMEDLQPELSERRINVDCGAVFGGWLCAVVLVDGKFEKFISIKNENPTFIW